MWSSNPSDFVSVKSLLSLIRRALTSTCDLNDVKVARFTVHSLRVGGINYYRSLGVPLEIRVVLRSGFLI